jgi:hypothetical protein
MNSYMVIFVYTHTKSKMDHGNEKDNYNEN